MALVTDRVAIIGSVGFVEITYDDALAVTIPANGIYDQDLTNCDLVSIRVVVFDGAIGKYQIRRGQSKIFQEGSIAGPFDETFNAGGPLRKIKDLAGYTFGGGP